MISISGIDDSSSGLIGGLASVQFKDVSECPDELPKRQRTYSTSASISTERNAVMRAAKGTIYTAGRPPWYDSQGVRMETFVIGISGGSASGKTTVARKIIETLGVPWVTLLSMDSFYNVLNKAEEKQAAMNEYNFDEPDAFDFPLLIETLKRLKEGRKVDVPIYNFVTNRRENKTVSLYGANVVIFEGILAFHKKEVLKMLDMKVFVDTDADIRLTRRLTRDIGERGRDIKSVLKQYERHVKPAFDSYIAPSMIHADIIVPGGGYNEVAVDLIVNHVQTQMDQRGLKLRQGLAGHNPGKDQPLPSSLKMITCTNEIENLKSQIRRSDLNRDTFVSSSVELIHHVVKFALFSDKLQDCVGNGLDICGVSVLRSAKLFENKLKDLVPDCTFGKIQIETCKETRQPELHELDLPEDIKVKRVILMDATVATGATAMMAIRVLLDHEVLEENITLVSLITAAAGVHTVTYAFPKVTQVTADVYPEINGSLQVLARIGNFENRYYGSMKHQR